MNLVRSAPVSWINTDLCQQVVLIQEEPLTAYVMWAGAPGPLQMQGDELAAILDELGITTNGKPDEAALTSLRLMKIQVAKEVPANVPRIDNGRGNG